MGKLKLLFPFNLKCRRSQYDIYIIYMLKRDLRHFSIKATILTIILTIVVWDDQGAIQRASNIQLPILADDTIVVETKEDLYAFLVRRNIPYPETWVAISILEAGHKWESELATLYHNFMGFNYSRFKRKHDCAEFLIRWINQNPPIENESSEQFLIRRRYNPNMQWYLRKLKDLSIFN